MLRRSAVLTIAAVLAACTPPDSEGPAPSRLVVERARFQAIDGWTTDRQGAALAAFVRSCERITAQPAERELKPVGIAGRVGDWKTVCAAARSLDTADNTAARSFFERWFTPWAASDNGKKDGLFTGYYEAEIKASRVRDDRFTIPVLKRPPDLVTVDLGQFRDSLKGERIAGRIVDGRLVPFADRAAITGGALAGQNLSLFWTDDPVALFILQIQGSGRAYFDDGSVARIGYDGTNGHPYISIGKVLIDRGEVARADMSLQAIRNWIAAHPDQRDALLDLNPSYVFFRILSGEGPVGAQGVALTPGRSLAVDRRFLPLGVPIWLDTTNPVRAGEPLRRLMVAQDTGGAIRGPVRGDVFFGHGAEAEAMAGAMKQTGRYVLLLPRGVEPESR